MASSSSRTSVTITDPARIASYNRGPITEKLSFPDSCTQTITFGLTNYYFGHLGSYFDKDCIAPGTREIGQLTDTSAWKGFFYSPALCPHGWTTAAVFTSCVSIFADPTCISIGTATSAALCCPSGYSSHSLGRRCTSSMTRGQVVTVRTAEFDGQKYDAKTAVTVPILSDTIVQGDGIPIYWQSSDLEVLSRAAAMTPTGTASSVASPSNADASPSSVPSSPGALETGSPPPAGLSTGAKAGVGAGVPIAVIAALIMGVFLWKRQRGRKVASEGMTTQRAELGAGKQVHMAPDHDQHWRYEMQGVPEASVHELPATAQK